MDVPARIENDRTLIPVRFVSENLNQDVAFDGATQTITITSKTGQPQKQSDTGTANMSLFFHTYNLRMPGSLVNGNFTPGADNGTLTINSDGTYEWNSMWDGKVIPGNWRIFDEKDGYPIVLENAQEGKDWRVGASNETIGGDIIVWDGTFYYIGTKVE